MNRHLLKYIYVILALTQYTLAAYVQVGDNYSKVSYKKAYKNTTNQHIQSLIENTVLINSPTKKGLSRGTGFYIGEHRGRHLFLTNAHVLTAKECKAGAKVTFLKHNMKTKKVNCEEVLTSLYVQEKSDVTLFSLSSQSVEEMKGQGLEIDMNFVPKSGLLLASNGFGIKGSATKLKQTRFSANTTFDNDCAIASKDDSLVFISNFNTANVFATGCDMTSGDSGSAMIDRETGKVVGIIFLVGKNAKKKNRISSSYFWSKLVGSNNSQIWTSMSYAISLRKLLKELSPFLEI